jgi:hypothetical protein
MPLHSSRRGRLGLSFVALVVAALIASIALADDASDRDSYLRDIDARLSSAASELSGVKSDSDDGDIRDADGYIDQVRDLVGRLNSVKGDDSRARDVAERYPGYLDKWKPASAALHNMKGYQNGNVTLMKTCQDKNAELVAQARDFENRNDPSGLEQLPRLAAEAKNLTVRFLEEAEKFRAQMEDWNRTVHYFDVSDGKWADVKSVLQREADDIYGYYKSDQDTAKERCRDLAAGVDHPVVREVLGKLANSSAGRKEVLENLTRLMGELASKIREVPGASGTSAVDAVREKLDAIDSTLQILDRTKGADGQAKAIAETWPNIAREARASIEPLKELKEFHHVLDELPGRCRELEAKLDAFISSNGDDADGIDKIPAFATELGNPVIVGLAKAQERLDKMRSARENVQRFTRSDAGWADISAAYRASAQAIYDFFEERYKDTASTCKDLVRTVEHPKVKAAIDKLRGRAGNDGDGLDRDVDQWVERARATYRLDCQAMQDMWEAYCGTDWEPNDSEPGERPKQTAAALQDSMQRAMGPVLKELDPLQDRVDRLLAKRETRGRGESISRKLDKERQRLKRLSVSDVWRGANDPVRFYAAEYGKDQHKSLYSSYSCDVPTSATARARFPGSGHTDPDCIVADKCQVWEFKPDSPTGHSDGENQKDSYERLIAPYYTSRMRDNEAPPSELGGSAVMDKLTKACRRGDQIELRVNVHYYKMCEKKYECISD